jgi:hypothetical protein
MSTAPFGPHGPQVPAHTTTPNPTAQSAPILIGGNDQVAASAYQYAAAGAAGAGGGIGILVIDAVLTLFTLLYFWPFFACLYPLTVATGVGAAWMVRPLIAGGYYGDEANALLGTLLILAAIVVAVMIRVEYRLAQVPAFRLARHALRLSLFAVLAAPTVLWLHPAVQLTYTMYLLTFFSQPGYLAGFLRNPINLGIVLAIVIGLHLLLWKGERARAFWHRRLRHIGLK